MEHPAVQNDVSFAFVDKRMEDKIVNCMAAGIPRTYSAVDLYMSSVCIISYKLPCDWSCSFAEFGQMAPLYVGVCPRQTACLLRNELHSDNVCLSAEIKFSMLTHVSMNRSQYIIILPHGIDRP
jgi:hypothetical protein